MPNYLMPKARCLETGQTVNANNLGTKFTLTQRIDAERESQRLAENMQKKTSRTWTGFVEEYTVATDGRTRL